MIILALVQTVFWFLPTVETDHRHAYGGSVEYPWPVGLCVENVPTGLDALQHTAASPGADGLGGQ
jgi:hypothetical protein